MLGDPYEGTAVGGHASHLGFTPKERVARQADKEGAANDALGA